MLLFQSLKDNGFDALELLDLPITIKVALLKMGMRLGNVTQGKLVKNIL